MYRQYTQTAEREGICKQNTHKHIHTFKYARFDKRLYQKTININWILKLFTSSTYAYAPYIDRIHIYFNIFFFIHIIVIFSDRRFFFCCSGSSEHFNQVLLFGRRCRCCRRRRLVAVAWNIDPFLLPHFFLSLSLLVPIRSRSIDYTQCTHNILVPLFKQQ